MLCVCSVTRSDIDINERKFMLAAGVRDMHVCSFVTRFDCMLLYFCSFHYSKENYWLFVQWIYMNA